MFTNLFLIESLKTASLRGLNIARFGGRSRKIDETSRNEISRAGEQRSDAD